MGRWWSSVALVVAVRPASLWLEAQLSKSVHKKRNRKRISFEPVACSMSDFLQFHPILLCSLVTSTICNFLSDTFLIRSDTNNSLCLYRTESCGLILTTASCWCGEVFPLRQVAVSCLRCVQVQYFWPRRAMWGDATVSLRCHQSSDVDLVSLGPHIY